MLVIASAPNPKFASERAASACELRKRTTSDLEEPMTIRLHRGDLPDISRYQGAIAVDTEAMGLDARRDRLCVVQLSSGDGSADVVQLSVGQINAPNIKKLLGDTSRLKIFHFAR